MLKNNNTITYRKDIDGLRAIAVLSVLFYHLDFKLLKGGFVGVDIFFVISGFLITKIICQQIINGDFLFSKFYIKRIRRLFPALIFTLYFSLVLSIIFHSPLSLIQFSKSMLYALLSISNYLFYFENDYFDLESTAKPLLHTWSLGVEEQFYLIWPIILFFIFSRKPKALPFVILTISLSSFLTNLHLLGEDTSRAFFLTPFRAYEFGFGAILPFIETKRISFWIKEICKFIGLILCFFSIFYLSDKSLFPGWNSIIPCLGAALFILPGQTPILGKVFSIKLLLYFGLRSYSIYLIHWPIIVFAYYYNFGEITLINKFITIISIFSVSEFMYRYIETPFRNKTFNTKPFISYINKYLIILIILGSVPFLIMNSQGLLFRINVDRQYINYFSDLSSFHRTYYGGVACSNPKCTNNKVKNNEIMVFGDSFSRALHHGFIKYYNNLKTTFFEAGGCDFFSQAYLEDKQKKLTKRCLKVRKLVYQELNQHSRTNPSTQIFLSQRWSPMVEGTFKNKTTGESKKFSSPEEFAEFVISEVNNLVDTYKFKNFNVIGAYPTFGRSGSPLDCILRPFVNKNCKKTNLKNKILSRSRRINDYINSNAERLNFKFINPFDFLCNNQSCTNVTDEDLPIYSDSSHLSIWGSDFFVKEMKKLFKQEN